MSDVIHILYVEDNENDFELLAMCFARYNYTKKVILEHVETIEEAKEKFNIDKHIAVLVDWNLPDGEGPEVVEFLRHIKSDLPVLLLSGALTQQHLDTSVKCNATTCLEKNYNKIFVDYIYSLI